MTGALGTGTRTKGWNIIVFIANGLIEGWRLGEKINRRGDFTMDGRGYEAAAGARNTRGNKSNSSVGVCRSKIN